MSDRGLSEAVRRERDYVEPRPMTSDMQVVDDVVRSAVLYRNNELSRADLIGELEAALVLLRRFSVEESV